MISLHFLHPEFLFLLIALPLLYITHEYYLRYSKRKGMHFANFETLKRVTGETVFTKNRLMLWLRIVTLTALIFALSQPTLWYEGDSSRTDFVIAIDNSASMTATDLSPNRIEAAKQSAIDFVDSINTSARIGIISFSGTVSIVQDLSPNKEVVKQAIRNVEIDRISGTDIGGALVSGTNLLTTSGRDKAIILVTDGSNTAGTFLDDPVLRGVAYAQERRVRIHTIGIGTDESALSGYLPRIYNITATYNEGVLFDAANQTGGVYVRANSAGQLDNAYNTILGNSVTTIQERELWMGLLLVALFIIFIEWGLLNTRYRLLP